MKKIKYFTILLLALVISSCSEKEQFDETDIIATDEDVNNKQNHALDLPLRTNVTNIPVFIAIHDKGSSGARQAILLALEKWESISGCAISFIEFPEPTSIGINFINSNDSRNTGQYSQFLPECLAQAPWSAQFPQGDGYTGHYIRQMDGGGTALNQDDLVAVVMHEIGHTFGLIHTNHTNEVINENECNPDPSGPISMACTPDSDPGSIMNSTPGGTDFTNADLRASRMMFPSSYNPSITNHDVKYQTQSTRSVTLEFNSDFEFAYKIEVLRYYPNGGSLAQTYYTGCWSNGSYSMNVTPWPGSWDFKVRYKNVNGDYVQTSSIYTVDMD